MSYNNKKKKKKVSRSYLLGNRPTQRNDCLFFEERSTSFGKKEETYLKGPFFVLKNPHIGWAVSGIIWIEFDEKSGTAEPRSWTMNLVPFCTHDTNSKSPLRPTLKCQIIGRERLPSQSWKLATRAAVIGLVFIAICNCRQNFSRQNPPSRKSHHHKKYTRTTTKVAHTKSSITTCVLWWPTEGPQEASEDD